MATQKNNANGNAQSADIENLIKNSPDYKAAHGEQNKKCVPPAGMPCGELWFDPLRVNDNYIPDELKDIHRWVCWRLEPNKNPEKKPRKVPKQAVSGKNASSTNPATWCDYKTALNAYNKRKDEASPFSGIGFVLIEGDDIVGIDLDNVIQNQDGSTKVVTSIAVKKLITTAHQKGTYIEKSPSGSGFRILVRGQLADAIKNDAVGVEVYTTGRYLTITGHGRGELQVNQEVIDLAVEAGRAGKAKPKEPEEFTANPREKVKQLGGITGDELGSGLTRPFVFDFEHFKVALFRWNGSEYEQRYLDKPENTDLADEGVFMNCTRAVIANYEAAPDRCKEAVKELWVGHCEHAMVKANKKEEYNPEGNNEKWDGWTKDFRAAQVKRDAGEENVKGITATRLYWAVDLPPSVSRAPKAVTPSFNVLDPKPIWNLTVDEKQLFPDTHIEKDAQNGAVKKVTVQATEDNIKHVLNLMGLVFAYNVITKKMVSNIVPSGMTKQQEAISIYDKIHSRAYSMLSKNSIKASNLEGFLKSAAGELKFNPVILYLDNLQWDEVPRFGQLAAALNAGDPAMALLFVRVFMMQAVALADGCERSPHLDKIAKGEYVPLMHGGQGAKKSTLFPKLVPAQLQQYVGSVPELDPDDKDSLLRALGFWIVEVGEIDTQFRRKETERYKAFLSMSTDEIRKPYGHEAVTMARRTMFCGSVNRQEALNDATGNRRYIPISVDTIDHGTVQQIDKDQLWAEAMARYLGGEQWWPTDNEQCLSDDAVREFETTDMIEDGIRQEWNFDLLRNSKQQVDQLTSTEIYETIFPEEANGRWRGTRQITNVMPKLYPRGWHMSQMRKKHGGVTKWTVPKT